ncbi:MAG: hypothetical protein WBP85_16755, partial [Terracidiphilus sp.]
MDHLQAKMFFKGVIVAVTVQELISGFNAKRRDNAIDDLSHRNSKIAQIPVVLRGSNRRIYRKCLENRQCQKPSLAFAELPIRAHALQYLGEDQAC